MVAMPAKSLGGEAFFLDYRTIPGRGGVDEKIRVLIPRQTGRRILLYSENRAF